MSDKNLKKDIEEVRCRRPSNSLGLTISIFSILYGEFVFRVNDYLLAQVEPYFRGLPFKLFGVILLIAGLVKLIGILTNNTLARKIGIWSLTGMWSGLFALAVTFSFGTGYPHPGYLFNALPLLICLIVSKKGDYRE